MLWRKETKSWWSCPCPRRNGTHVSRAVCPDRQCYVGSHSLQLLSLRTLSSLLHLFWDFCQVHYTEDSLVDLKIGSPVSLMAILLQLWQIKHLPCCHINLLTCSQESKYLLFQNQRKLLISKRKKRTPYYVLKHFKIGEIPKHVQGTMWEMRIPADKIIAVS